MSVFEPLADDTIREIALSLSLKDIAKFCSTSRRFNQVICKDEFFWREKYLRDFSDGPIDYRGSWRELYLKAGTVWVSGSNNYGQLGLGDEYKKVDRQFELVKIPNLKVRQVSTGESHTIFIDMENDVWVCGKNEGGQLGLGDTKNRYTPTKIPNFKAKEISAGYNHTLFIDLENNVWGCGSNSQGQLGIGNNDQYFPIQIPNQNLLGKASRVAAGGLHSVIIDLENNVWVCGYNAMGQLGIGNKGSQYRPIKIPNFRGQQVSVGQHHTIIIDLENNIWGCGLNNVGQLGLSCFPVSFNLCKISNLKARQVSTRNNNTLIIDMENNVWGWGFNEYGELGLDDINSILIPTQIPNFRARQVSVGGSHSLLIDLDYRIWGCGDNRFGQLGFEDIHKQTKLIEITDIEARQVSAGHFHTVIIE